MGETRHTCAKACRKTSETRLPYQRDRSPQDRPNFSSCVPRMHSSPVRIDMKNFADSIVRFLKEEDGPTAVEYAVMLALIVVVCLAAVGTIGTEANTKFQEVGAGLAAN